MNEVQTLAAIDEALSAIRALQAHSMVATEDGVFAAQERLALIRRQFVAKHAQALDEHMPGETDSKS